LTATVERQRWLAALALAVAVPLPLTGIVSWPFLGPFLVAAVWVAISRRPVAPPPAWLENVLAPVILIAVVAAGGVQYGILRPVSQLAVLVAAVRLPGCGQRARTASSGGILALVGVAGIASSTHPALALYLVALLAFVLLAVGRLTGVALAEGAGTAGGGPAWPPMRLVVGSVVLAVLVATPLFVLLPRLRSPFAAGPFGARSTSGFREAVMLHGIGDVKQSRRIVMRVTFPGVERRHVSPEWLRLVGATVRHYRAGGWVEGRLKGQRLAGRPDRPVALVDGTPAKGVQLAQIVLERDTRVLFAPVGAVGLTVDASVPVTRELSGVLRIPRGAELPLSYGVEFDPLRVEQPPPDDVDLELPPGSDDLRELANRVAGSAPNALAAALAIEQHLQRGYTYTLRFRAPIREDPVQWFLFRSHEGHCEFFASSMVLLLRTLGIPARLQAGYAGGETDGEGGFVVRDSNAHAWVVAYVGGSWRIFDPTPAEGRPGILDAPGGPALRWGWQQLESLWDRWVLTFSMADQVEIGRSVLDALAVAAPFLPPVGLGFGVLVVVVLVMRARRKGSSRAPRAAGRPTPVTRALVRVMSAAARRGAPVRPSMTPREFEGVAAAAFPASGEELAWLVHEHERSRYAGEPEPPRRVLRHAVRRAERAFAAR
jgi:transglutaminase-like putative cysteine protease